MHWPGSRAEHQIACLRPIARCRRLTQEQRFLLLNVVTTYLNLRGETLAHYQAMLAEPRHWEVRTMIMTWADKMEAKAMAAGMEKGLLQGRQLGVQEGRQEGRQEGMKEVVLRLLSRRFSPLPAAVKGKVAALASTEELASLADRILEARSLEELGLA